MLTSYTTAVGPAYRTRLRRARRVTVPNLSASALYRRLFGVQRAFGNLAGVNSLSSIERRACPVSVGREHLRALHELCSSARHLASATAETISALEALTVHR